MNKLLYKLKIYIEPIKEIDTEIEIESIIQDRLKEEIRDF
jgi:hypothetical protein